MKDSNEFGMNELHIDELEPYKFDHFNDKRASNVQYEIGDCLQSGLAMFLLKDSSLLEFNNRFAQRADNILRIFKIKKCPSDGQMRQILDEVNPLEIERVKRAIIQLIGGILLG